MTKEHGQLGLVVIDYLQLMRGSTRTAVEQRNLTNQSAALQDAVRDREREVRNLSLEAARERALAEVAPAGAV